MNNATNYYLFSFQINDNTNTVFEANAKLEKDKVIFEFKIDDKTQKELMKMFTERFKLVELGGELL